MSSIIKCSEIRNKRFFSLIILVLSIAVVTIIFFPKCLCIPKKWQCQQYEMAQTKMQDMVLFIKQFYLQKGSFPNNLELLEEYLGQPQIIHMNTMKIDPWASLFVYQIRKDHASFLLYSVGRNGQNEFTHGDDIVFNTKQNREVYCD